MTRARWAVLVATTLGGASGCISMSTYEHDLAIARAETKAAQAAQAAQAEALSAALQAMHKALAAESELRAVTVRTLEAQLHRMGDERGRGGGGSSGEAASAREELARLREQEKANAERLRRLEESLLQLVSRPPAGPPGSTRLHQYPY